MLLAGYGVVSVSTGQQTHLQFQKLPSYQQSPQSHLLPAFSREKLTMSLLVIRMSFSRPPNDTSKTCRISSTCWWVTLKLGEMGADKSPPSTPLRKYCPQLLTSSRSSPDWTAKLSMKAGGREARQVSHAGLSRIGKSRRAREGTHSIGTVW